MRYTAVAEVGKSLEKLLRTYMVPEVLEKPNHIGLGSPADRGDQIVGIWLYDIRECGEIRQHTMRPLDSVRQRYPSLYLNLFYMITVFSGSDIKYRSEEEHRILGKVMQVLNDFAVFEELIQAEGSPDGETAPTIEFLNLNMEEKLRIWNMPDTAYRTSLFYRVGPVEIESGKTRKTSRVTDITIEVKNSRQVFSERLQRRLR